MKKTPIISSQTMGVKWLLFRLKNNNAYSKKKELIHHIIYKKTGFYVFYDRL